MIPELGSGSKKWEHLTLDSHRGPPKDRNVFPVSRLQTVTNMRFPP